MIHMMRPLFQKSAEQQQVEALQARLRSLISRRLGCIGGRQVYCKALSALASQWKVSGKAAPEKVRQTHLMQMHGGRSSQQPEKSKASFEAQAAVAQALAAEAHTERVEETMAELDIARQ
eukprot:3128164-Lingulodinium_polyedra.AAC.1